MKICVYVFLLLLLIVRFFISQPVYKNGQNLTLSQQVLQEPVRYSSYQSVTLSGIKMYLPLYPEISYGDKITVSGIYQNGKLTNPKLVSVKESGGLFDFRKYLIAFYQKNLPEPHASLVAGIIIGSKANIPVTFWGALKYTGVAHAVVASGTNVTFVAGFLISVFTLFFSRRRSVILTIIAVWIYTVISGLDSPIIRAAIMATVAFGAQALGKLALAWKTLILTVYLMLMYNPAYAGDIGFIMTFVSVISLMLFQKKIEIILSFLPKFLKESLSTSLAAQIGVGPILYVTFGQFNILSPLINALVLWTVGPIMVIGAISALLGLRWLLYLVYPLTWWFINIVGLFSV
jgi:competence protein ComEC